MCILVVRGKGLSARKRSIMKFELWFPAAPYDNGIEFPTEFAAQKMAQWFEARGIATVVNQASGQEGE
jgi:hypothetical protein